MAGAGYKLFAAGDVLSASDVNTYMMQQTVMVFANSTARTTALSGVLAEGMVSYLKDTNVLEVYDGSAWVGATGDITGLTAGTGVSITSATGPVPTVAIDTAVVPRLGVANTFTVGPQTLEAGASVNIPLIVKGAVGQSTDLMQFQDSTGTVLAKMSRIPRFVVGTDTNATLSATNAAATTVGLVVRGAASQTANLQEWQNSAGTVLSYIDNNGNFRAPIFGSVSGGLTNLRTNYDTNGVGVVIGGAAQKGLIVRGAASQTANLQEWQDSAGTVTAKIDSVGYFGTRGMFGLNGRFSFEEAFGGAFAMIQRSTSTVANPGSDKARIYIVSGTNAGTLKLVVRAGASGAETTILDNIPQ